MNSKFSSLNKYWQQLKQRGFIHLLFSVGAIQALSLLQRLILTKSFLTVEEVGTFSVLIMAFNLFCAFAFLNIYQALPKYIPTLKESPESYLIHSLRLSSLSWLLVLILYYLLRFALGFSFLSPDNQRWFDTLVIFSFGMVFYSHSIHYLVGIGSIKKRSLYDLLFRLLLFISLLSAAGIFSFKGFIYTFGLYHLIVPLVLMAIILWPVLKKGWVRLLWQFSSNTQKQLLKFGFYETTVILLFSLTDTLDVFILDKQLASATLNGYYSTAKLFITVFPLTAYALIQSYTAQIASKSGILEAFSLIKKLWTVLGVIFIIYAALGFLMAEPLFSFLGERYLKAVPIFYWLLVGGVFKGLHLLNLAILLYTGYLKSRITIVIFELIIYALAFNLAIHWNGYIGLAQAYLFSTIAVCLFSGGMILLKKRDEN